MDLFNATLDAATARQQARQWSSDTELLAQNVEMTYSLLSAFVSAYGGGSLPEFRVPRPTDEPVVPVAVSPGAAASMLMGGV